MKKRICQLLLFLALAVCAAWMPGVTAMADQEIHTIKVEEISKTSEGYPIYVMNTDVGGVQAIDTCWYNSSGNICTYSDFVEGGSYSYAIFFEPYDGYCFAADLKCENCSYPTWVNGMDCYKVERAYVCPAPIHTMTLYGVTLPVEGELANNQCYYVLNGFTFAGSWNYALPQGYAAMRYDERFKGLGNYVYHGVAKPGNTFYFADDLQVTLNGNPIGYTKDQTGNITINYYYTCPTSKTVVDSVAVTDVTLPVAGNHPSNAHSDHNAVRFVSVYWSETEKNEQLASSATFEAGKSYTLTVWFEPKDDYLLSDTLVCTVNGVQAVRKGTSGSTRGIYEYTYVCPAASKKVSFDLKGHGSAINAQTVESGKTATEPTAPTEKGWKFVGWYFDSACTNTFSFSNPINTDITLYALWEEEPKASPSPSKSPSPTKSIKPTASPKATASVQPTTSPKTPPTASDEPTYVSDPKYTPGPTSVGTDPSDPVSSADPVDIAPPGDISNPGDHGADVPATQEPSESEPSVPILISTNTNPVDAPAVTDSSNDNDKPAQPAASAQTPDPTQAASPDATGTDSGNNAPSPVLWMILGAVIALAVVGAAALLYIYVFRKKKPTGTGVSDTLKH